MKAMKGGWRLWLAALILVGPCEKAFSQDQPPDPTVLTPPLATPAPAPAIQPVELEVGTGRLVQLPGPATTVLAADPRIARVQPASATTLFLMGVASGRTTVIATADDGVPIAEYDVMVVASPADEPEFAPDLGLEATQDGVAPLDAAAIEAAIHRTVTGADQVRVEASDNTAVLSGSVATGADAQAVLAVVRGFLGKGQTVANRLTVLSGIQVNVRVRAIEVSREVTRELGFNWQALFSSGSFALGFVTGGAGPFYAGATIGGQILSSLNGRTANLNGGLPNRIGIGYRSANFDLNAIIDALAADQLITVLAEPNLTAQSGETASFLAGGEFPIPVAADDDKITIEFKPFGVSLAFVPTVLSPDRLNLRVRPEVSELSDNGAIDVPIGGGSLRIPALSVRRAETTVELGSGQSFAIAGLLQRSTAQLTNGVLGLSELPVLGALFKSEAFRRNETELVIIVTPYLVQPVSDPKDLATPLDDFRPATDLERILLHRQAARGQVPDPVGPEPFDAGFIVE
ncbi:type II and III secretion system protein family protein [Geminicoccus roseus]|uniref:type II and III secretion system protein family protein n=1 Tax=Geminicoccus roseus TaxID=404900 RepID=UPI0003FD49FA|nr:type II and III secretion system protein family protein [Geminicoccus roseus]